VKMSYFSEITGISFDCAILFLKLSPSEKGGFVTSSIMMKAALLVLCIMSYQVTEIKNHDIS
jgi:hypothetical protein